MRMLVEPEAERPLTPAAATPSFKMQSAAGAELARRRREAMSARPTPGYVRKRPQSAPAAQRRQVATERQGEYRDATVAEPFRLHRQTTGFGHSVLTPRPGSYRAGSGIGLSDKNGLLSELRDKMRSDVLAPALQRHDPEHTGLISASDFHTCLRELNIRLNFPQVQWIFAAVGDAKAGAMDYESFCERLGGNIRIGAAKHATETHGVRESWIWRKEELSPPLPPQPNAAAALHAGIEPEPDAVSVELQPRAERPQIWNGSNAPCNASTVHEVLNGPEGGAPLPLKDKREFYARGKEGWVGASAAEERQKVASVRRVQREKQRNHRAMLSEAVKRATEKAAGAAALRTMKENWRRDNHEAMARAANVYNPYAA